MGGVVWVCIVHPHTGQKACKAHADDAQCERDTRTAMPWLAAFKQCISEVRDLLV